MSFSRSICFVLVLMAFAGEAFSRSGLLAGSDSLNTGRRNGVYIVYVAGVSVSYAVLNSHKEFSDFRLYNDNRSWLQMDKLMHMALVYQMGEYGTKMLRWAGVDNKKAVWQGGLMGLLFLTGNEVLDGFTDGGGFSWGDQLANMAGAGLLIGQNLVWGEQRFRMKYSYSPSSYAQYRPELLGRNLTESWLKDYNGKTNWISFSPGSFIENSRFPSWLCLSVGYSAGGMIDPFANPRVNSAGEAIPEFERYRQYFLSLDVDLTKLEPRSRVLQTIFSAFSFVKIPFPALEYNSMDGVRIRPLYF